MGLYLAIHADPMRFCKRTPSNRARLLSGHGLADKDDPMHMGANPRREFLGKRLASDQQLRKESDSDSFEPRPKITPLDWMVEADFLRSASLTDGSEYEPLEAF